MFGPPGHAYVYLCYGLHNMLNIVTNCEGEGAGVLIRSCEIYSGHEIILKRRGNTQNKALVAGPGNVGKALAVSRSDSGHALYESGGLEVRDAPSVKNILVGPRVGIDYADLNDRLAPYRFADACSTHVTQKKKLTLDSEPV